MENFGTKPEWLTFDCYVEPRRFIEVFDRYEHALEQEKPHRLFQSVAAESLRLTMAELGLRHEPGDAEILTSGISKMPPFPEVVGVGGSRLPGISKSSQGAKTGEKRPFGDKHPYHQGGQP